MLLLVPQALAEDVTLGALVRSEVGYDPVPDFELEDFVLLNDWARVWAEVGSARGDLWFVEGRLQHHVTLGLRDDDTVDLEGWWELGLGEAGFDGRLGGEGSPVSLRAGALVERWGRLDLLPGGADVLNPRDFRSGLLTPTEWQRMPIPMAVVAVGSASVRAETVLIPFASADRVWVRETNWSYARQGFAQDLIADLQAGVDPTDPLKEVLTGVYTSVSEMDPTFRRQLDTAVNLNELPQAVLYNGEVAERIELSVRNVELAVMGGYLRSRQTDASLDPALAEVVRTRDLPSEDPAALAELQAAAVGGPLDVTWPRTAVAGADASALAGPLQLRAETMFASDRVIRQPYAQATTRPQLTAGLGVDYVRGSSLQVTLESRWTHLFDPPAKLLFALPDQVQVAGGMRWSFASNRLQLQLGGVVDPTFGEGLVRPTFGWRASDHVQLELGGLVMTGSTPAPADLDEAFVYEGGPISYFQQNDVVTLAVQLIR